MGRNSSTESRNRPGGIFFFLKWAFVCGLVMGAIGAIAVAAMFWIYGSDPNLPTINSLSDYRPLQVSRVLSSDGQVVGEVFKERRTFVPYEDLPEVLVYAFVAAEDANFFKHKGIDYMGMVRALLVNIKAGRHRQGGSTITQQVVKNFLLTPEKSLKRKFQEIILARRLENQLSKQEIITLYANQIFFGDGRYGVEEASRYYFGKNVRDINLGEAALLAGMPKAPNRYSPRKEKNHEAAKNRQVYVLGQMVATGKVSQEEAQKWVDAPIEVAADPFPTVGVGPEWVGLAKSALEAKYGEEEILRQGVDVVTTLDVEAQKIAQTALQKGLRTYDLRKGYGHALRTIPPKRIAVELKRMKKRMKSEPVEGRRYQAVVLSTHDSEGEVVVDLGGYRASLLLAEQPKRYQIANKKPSERFKKGNVLNVVPVATGKKLPSHSEHVVNFANGPEGAVVIIEPKTRRVLAVVGGYSSRVAGFNRATMARRQAGSTFKPFVYGAAIDSGDYTPSTLVNDAPEVYDLWKPENYQKGEFKGAVRLRFALAKSINTVAIRVAHEIGPGNIATFAKSLGIESSLPSTLSLALGSGEVTPMELTNAFAVFAAKGMAAKPQVLSEFVSRESKEEVPAPTMTQVLTPQVAYVTLDMMRSVITEGTGGRARRLKMDIAGKTGTSNDSRDAWFVGVSPNYAVGVWVGFDDFSRSLGTKESGGQTALPVFVEIMGKLGKRSDRFEAPDGVIELKIDSTTGKIAHPSATEGVVTDVFVKGSEPTEIAPAPGDVTVDDFVLDQYGGEPSGEPTGWEEIEPPEEN